MNKLHKHFLDNVGWYRRWHNLMGHQIYHWALFAWVVVTVFIIVGANNRISFNLSGATGDSITTVSNEWLSVLNGGENNPRDMLYADGFLWVLTQTFPSKLLKIDPSNPSVWTSITFPSDKKHDQGVQLVYVNSQQKLYAMFGAGLDSLEQARHVYISQVDPATMTFIDVINDPDFFGTNGAITTDESNLFVSTFGFPGEQNSSVIKYRLSDFGRVASVSLGLGVDAGWAIVYDGSKIYVAGDQHSSAPAWFARLSTDLTVEQVQWTSVTESEAGHHMVVDGDYLWSAIRPGKFVRMLKSDLSKFTEIPTGLRNEWTRAGTFSAGGYIWTCNSSFSNAQLARINPVSLEIQIYEFPAGQNSCIAIQGDSQNLYFAFYQSPGQISSTLLSSLVSPTPTPTPTPIDITSYQVSARTATAATIIWTTNVPSTGRIRYGLASSNLNLIANDSVVSTSHSLTLNGLTSTTVYYYRIIAIDEGGVNYDYTPVSGFRTRTQ